MTPTLTSLNIGDTALFTITAYVTDPTAYIELDVFQPLGYNVSNQAGQ
jgi:hypothetical protein